MKKIFIFVTIIGLAVLGSFVHGEGIGIKFSHQLHVQEMGAECMDCHDVAESTAPTDNLIPDHDTCFACHDENETECSTCHVNGDDPTGMPDIITYIAKFPHKTHVEQNIDCNTCHTSIAFSEEPGELHLPKMAKCQNCHSDLEAANYCLKCHSSSEQLAPASHSLDWRNGHGITAHVDDASCKTCHSESSCLECHQGDNLDRKVHALNFVNNHSLTARNKMDNCYTCHEEQEFCISCHRDQLVMPKNHNTAGWSNLSNGGRHARVAKMDLDNCLACHNDNYGEPICAQCHNANN